MIIMFAKISIDSDARHNHMQVSLKGQEFKVKLSVSVFAFTVLCLFTLLVVYQLKKDCFVW